MSSLGTARRALSRDDTRSHFGLGAIFWSRHIPAHASTSPRIALRAGSYLLWCRRRYDSPMVLVRRSRSVRAPLGKALILTDRDHRIFAALARYRYLRSSYLHAFAGGHSGKRFKERLGDLFHEGYIDRPEQQWERADGRYTPAVYELGKRGRQALYEVPPAVTFLGQGAHRQFAHALLSCACLASIELATVGRPLRFVSWPEILAKAPEATRCAQQPERVPVGANALVPDGLFGLEYKSDGAMTYRFFALELDRGTMPLSRSDSGQTSYFGKLDLYREMIDLGRHTSFWGLPNLLVLSVMPEDARLSGTLARLQSGLTAAAFLFRSVEPKVLNEPVPSLLDEPWMRAELPAFGIGSP